MVKKIVGFDEDGKKVFERDARQYDQSIVNTTFGLTLADVIKVVPIIILMIGVYVNQQSFNATILRSVDSLAVLSSDNAKAIGGMKEALNNLNNYLSSSTGKQFENGRPR